MKNLTRAQLLERTVGLVREERRITMELIAHLREIERRMLFLELGFHSLYEFCVKHLGLSEGSAYRRISTMRLARDVPEAQARLESGELTLSVAARVNTVMQKQKRVGDELQAEEKARVVREVSGLTQAESDVKLWSLLPAAAEALASESSRAVGPESLEIKVVLDAELRTQFEELKDLMSHQVPDGSVKEILRRLVAGELERRKKSRDLAARSNETKSSGITAPLRRAVWKRAGNRCEISGCGSRRLLEVDHVVAAALGGEHTLENLRLTCRKHNAYFAVRTFGAAKMQRYMPSVR